MYVISCINYNYFFHAASGAAAVLPGACGVFGFHFFYSVHFFKMFLQVLLLFVLALVALLFEFYFYFSTPFIDFFFTGAVSLCPGAGSVFFSFYFYFPPIFFFEFFHRCCSSLSWRWRRLCFHYATC
jgi:hypothetical protein